MPITTKVVVRLIDPEKADKDLKGYLVSTNVLYELMFSIRYIFSSPCQRQCELLPSLGIRRFLKIGQSETRIACGGHVC
jgi:hypothetical protein